MNRIKTIRERLGVTQIALAAGLGRTQGNISLYERGQMVPPDVARSLIVFARTKGVEVGYEDIYGPADQPAEKGVANA